MAPDDISNEGEASPDVTPPPRVLLNQDGRTFADEISSFVEILGSLDNDERKAFRDRNAQAIAQHDGSRLLIVAGPGAGKSFLFMSRIEFWLSTQSEESKVYVASFVRKLVRDLERDVELNISEDQQAQVTVSTLHTLARSLVERGHGSSARPYLPHVQIISASWQAMVWSDVRQFHTDLSASKYSHRAMENQLHTEEISEEPDWVAVRATYQNLSRFYNAIGFADLIVLAREVIDERSGLVVHDLWIIDEFQDFNHAEDHLIRCLTAQAAGVMIAGDDEQALYQRLKASLPEIIVSYYEGTEFGNAMLPFCSRCSYHVCIAASEFIAASRASGGIDKVYLPLVVNTEATKVQVVATNTPSSAFDYIKKFVEDHQEELDAHIARMESGDETDPFLLILTPDKKAGFYRTGGTDQTLLSFVDQWSPISLGRSMDYQLVLAYCRSAWDPSDNFAYRKVLDHENIDSNTVHDWIVYALEHDCSLASVPGDANASLVSKCGEVLEIVLNGDVDAEEKVSALRRLIRVSDPAALAVELSDHPIQLSFGGLDEEAEEVIQTAGALAPVEMMSIVGSKGLSAHHVMIIGCDDVNLDKTSRLTFFVGMTRARQSLHLIFSAKSGGSSEAHHFLGDLPNENCNHLVYKKTGRVTEHFSDAQGWRDRIAQWHRMSRRR